MEIFRETMQNEMPFCNIGMRFCKIGLLFLTRPAPSLKLVLQTVICVWMDTAIRRNFALSEKTIKFR